MTIFRWGLGEKSLEGYLSIANKLAWEVEKSLSIQLLMTEMGKAQYKQV